MKVRWRSVLLGLVLLASASARGDEVRQKSVEEIFGSLESPWLKLSDESMPLTRWNFWRLAPTGEPSGLRDSCRWSERPAPRPGDFEDFRAKFQLYDQECHKDFQNGPRDWVRNVVTVLRTRLDVSDHPYARHVLLELPGRVHLQGLLALHDGKPRPLVVFRTGIFSNTWDFAERFLFMQVFEQGPFNMLVLESMSGNDYVRRNSSLSFAGLDEGVQTLQILRRLRDPAEPLARLASSVHLLGMSMGGHGQMLAYFLQSRQSERPWVNSALMFCPLLDFKGTLDAHLGNRLEAFWFATWAKRRLPILFEREKWLREDAFLPDLIDHIAHEYKGPAADEPWIHWPAGLRAAKKEFWKGNSGWDEFKDIPTPLWILATKHDIIVPFRLNAEKLLNGEFKIGARHWMLTTLDEGHHCTLPAAYDWAETTSWIQSYLRGFSPELKMTTAEKSFALTDEMKRVLAASGFHPRLKFFLPTGSGRVRVQLTLRSHEGASFWENLFSPSENYEFPLSDFDFQREDPLRTQAEVDLYRRWLNQNLKARLAGDGQSVVFALEKRAAD